MKFTKHEDLEVYHLAFQAAMKIFEPETRVWLDFTIKCNYLKTETADKLRDDYSKIIGKLIIMYNQAEKWKL